MFEDDERRVRVLPGPQDPQDQEDPGLLSGIRFGDGLRGEGSDQVRPAGAPQSWSELEPTENPKPGSVLQNEISDQLLTLRVSAPLISPINGRLEVLGQPGHRFGLF